MKDQKTKQLYIIGGLAAAGLLYYVYQKNQSPAILPAGDQAPTQIPAQTRANVVASFKNDITKMQWSPEWLTKTPAALAALNDADLLVFAEYWNNYHVKGTGGSAPAALRDAMQLIVNRWVAAKNWPG